MLTMKCCRKTGLFKHPHYIHKSKPKNTRIRNNLIFCRFTIEIIISFCLLHCINTILNSDFPKPVACKCNIFSKPTVSSFIPTLCCNLLFTLAFLVAEIGNTNKRSAVCYGD